MHTLLIAIALCSTPQQEQGRDQKSATRSETPATNERTSKQIFSGPQPGERLPALKVKLLGEKEPVELVDTHGGKPVQVFFIHKVTRTAFSLMRPLARFASTQKKKNLRTIVVFLTDDPPAMDKQMQAIANYLKQDVKDGDLKVGVSPDGSNGPGIYGLNRNATLTVLLGKEGKVTANHAMGQPSLQIDGPKVAKSLGKLLGVPAPDLMTLSGRQQPTGRQMRDSVGPGKDPKLETMVLRMFTDRQTDEAIAKQIAEVEKYVGTNASRKGQLRAIAANSLLKRLSKVSNEPLRKKVVEWSKLPQPSMARRRSNGRQDPMIRTLIQPLIARDASEEEVVKVASRIVDYAKKNPKTRLEIGNICRRIIDANRLEMYGTPKAQEYMKQWAKDFKPAPAKAAPKRAKPAEQPSRKV